MLNRTALMEWLIKYSLVANNYNVGIVLPSFADAKVFITDFNAKLSTVPEWIRPKLFRCGPVNGIEFDSHYKIFLFYNDTASKGRTLNELYASSRVTTEQLAPHCFSVLRCNYTTFEDV